MVGRNLFAEYSVMRQLKEYDRHKPCVFISHSSRDKEAARKVAKVITDADLNIYFDENDEKLRQAASHGEDEAIVACIHDGLAKSTHALCLISANIVSSQWVPYEVGYSVAQEHELALLILKEVESLASFYTVASTLCNQEELRDYVISLCTEGHIPFSEVERAVQTALIGVGTILRSSGRPVFR